MKLYSQILQIGSVMECSNHIFPSKCENLQYLRKSLLAGIPFVITLQRPRVNIIFA